MRWGVLEEFGVKMIGANTAAIRKAEDRKEFKKSMLRIDSMFQGER
jgi:carbamoylphosphate synthase large subunit